MLLTRSAGVVGLALLVGAGCSRAGYVQLDLAETAAAADWQGSFQVILFGTLPAEGPQGKGFVPARREPGEDPFAWSRRESEVRLRWPEVQPRVLLVDLSPPPGLRSQAAEMRLNGKIVGTLAMDGRRRRHLVPLPPEAQRARQNRLEFDFEQRSPAGPATGRVAAAIYGLAIGSTEDPVLSDLLSGKAPPPLTASRAGGIPRLTQVGPSALRYALRVPPGAELRFRPGLHDAAARAGAAVRLRITEEPEGGPERELWSRTLSAREAAEDEVLVPLAAAPGEMVLLGLHVAGASGQRFAWGTWGAPRVMGRDNPSEPAPLTPPPAEKRRLEALRRSLAGANVLLVVLDAARARSFGCYGYARATTPEIDRIASEGVVFENAYTTMVYTVGAMASVWTSRHPDEHRAGLVQGTGLPPERPTLAELLSRHGIHTAGFAANAVAGPAFGLHRGFAEFREVFAGRPNGHDADALREELEPWLEAKRDRRFFAYAHFREPHFPYDPRPPFDTRFGPDGPLRAAARRDFDFFFAVNNQGRPMAPAETDHLVRLYDGSLAFADQELGALRKTLERLGLWDRTLVIVTADHGEALYEHGYVGHDRQLYEDSVRIPLILRFPAGRGPRGQRVAGLVDSRDLAPTIADAFGVLADEGARLAFTGRSLLPMALGAAGRSAVISRSTGELPSYALRDGRHAFLYHTKDGRQELYDAVADPGESRDLCRTRPVLAAHYRQSLARWFLGLERWEAPESQRAAVDPAQQENLKALGYVQ